MPQYYIVNQYSSSLSCCCIWLTARNNFYRGQKVVYNGVRGSSPIMDIKWCLLLIESLKGPCNNGYVIDFLKCSSEIRQDLA